MQQRTVTTRINPAFPLPKRRRTSTNAVRANAEAPIDRATADRITTGLRALSSTMPGQTEQALP